MFDSFIELDQYASILNFDHTTLISLTRPSVMNAPSTPSTTPLGSVQEELEANAEGSTRFIDTIRWPFLGTRRGGNATPKEDRGRNSMERKQKTPPRTWLHRVAAKLTISRGNKGTIKSNIGEKGARREGNEETSRRAGFKRKPIPSFAPPPNEKDGQDKREDTTSLSQRSSPHEGGTQASTHRSSTSIQTPRDTENHSADETNDQVWDFDEERGNCFRQSKDGEPPVIGNTISIACNSLPRSRGTPRRSLYPTASRLIL